MFEFADGTLSFDGHEGRFEIPTGPFEIDLGVKPEGWSGALNQAGALGSFNVQGSFPMDEGARAFFEEMRCPGCGVRFADLPAGHTWSARAGVCATASPPHAQPFPPSFRPWKAPRSEAVGGPRLRWRVRTDEGPGWSDWHTVAGTCPGCCCGGVRACSWCGGREHREPADNEFVPDELSHDSYCDGCRLNQAADTPSVQFESAQPGAAGLYALAGALAGHRGSAPDVLAMNEQTMFWLDAHTKALRHLDDVPRTAPAARVIRVPISVDESLSFGQLRLGYGDGSIERITVAQVAGESAVAQVNHTDAEDAEGGEQS